MKKWYNRVIKEEDRFIAIGISFYTREEKLKAMLECFIAVENINKDELRREVDLVLA